MFTFFKKENTKKPPDNVYTAINEELKRLHEQLLKLMVNESNGQTIWKRIELFQDVLMEMAKKQPSHHEEIKDLQNTVSEMLLLGDSDVLEKQKQGKN